MTTATRQKQNHRIMGRGAVITCGILTLLTPLGLLLTAWQRAALPPWSSIIAGAGTMRRPPR